MIKMLDGIFGWRFVVWRAAVIFAFICWIVAYFNGAFYGWSGRSGPFSLVIAFATWSFLLLVPVGYIFENFKIAIKLRFVGWLFVLYVAGWVLFFGWCLFDLFHGTGDLISFAFPFSLFYSAPSIPLSLVLCVARRI